MKHYIIFFIAVLSITACSNNKTEPRAYEWKSVDSLNGQIMAVDSALMGCYRFTLVNNSVIAHYARSGKPWHFKCYAISDDSLKCKGDFLGIGKGPKEALRAVITFDKGSNSLYIGASPGFVAVTTMYKVDMSNIENLFNLDKYIEINVPRGNSIDFFSPINATQFIASQLNEEDEKFYYYNTSDTTLTNLSIKYPEQPEPIDIGITEIAYNGVIVKHPAKQRFIYSSQYGNYVRLFDFNNGQLDNMISLFETHPTYGTRNINGLANFKPLADCKMGFSVATSSKCIYLLDRDYESSAGTVVMIFDWDGEPIRKLILDKSVSSIGIDRNDQILYAFSMATVDHEEQIVRFQL